MYADMFGWKEIADGVRDVLGGLPPASERRATILTANYGEAGAVDLFGSQYGLPGAVSGHNSYHLWGTVVIAVGFETAALEELFESVTLAKTVRNDYAREADVRVHVCRRLKIPLDDAWRRLKHYL